MVKGGVPHRRSVVAAMVVVFSLAFAITATARADAYIYWANLSGFGEGQIGRAQLDGDHVDRKFIRGAIGPSAITVDNRHVYWINADGGSIGRAKVNGTKVDQNFIRGVGFAYDLDIACGRIYWTRGQTTSTDASIARASLNGSDVERNFIQFDDPARFSTPAELQVQGGYIYWANAYKTSSIGRARIDGSEVDQTFIRGGLRNPFGLAVDDTHIYWTNRGTRSISSAKLNGGNVVIDLISGVGRVSTLAIGGPFLYWPGGHGSVVRDRLKGTGIGIKVIIGRGAPAYSLAVDDRGP
jgi:low-density lipoprotein receptor class B